MAQNLFDQPWFVSAVSPSSAERLFIEERYEEFVQKVNDLQKSGTEAKAAAIQVAKEMLGK